MKWKKVIAVVCTIMMAGIIASGCGKATGTQNSSTAASSAGNQVSSTAATEDPAKRFYVSENPLELSMHMHFWDTTAFNEGWSMWNEVSKLTNVKLKGTAPQSASSSAEVFNIMMASGQVADIVHSLKSNFNKYGPEGAFVPLNDLIEEHAPNFKNFLDQHPDVKRHITAADGKIYFISFVPDGAAAKGWFIRKDWLDKLGLEVPKTMNDYYNVMKAFKENDPNGNGKKDEVPYFSRANNGVIELLAFWGIPVKNIAREDTLYVDDNGKLYDGRATEIYKEAMINVQKWYAEGLIDAEIFTRGGSARDVLLGDNVGGSTHDWIGSTAGYNDKLKDKIPGFELAPIAPPADVNGKVIEYTSRDGVSDYGWGISSTNKNPIETIKFFDFWWTEEGRRFANFGIEGVHYDMADGKPVFKESVIKAEGGTLPALNKDGIQYVWGFHQDFEYELQWMNPIAKVGAKLYVDNKWPQPNLPKLSYTPEEQSVLDEYETSLDTYIGEMMSKWALGAESVEGKWDEYTSMLKKLGIEKVLETKQKAYDRFMK